MNITTTPLTYHLQIANPADEDNCLDGLERVVLSR